MKSGKQNLSTCSERQDWRTFRNLGPGWDDMRVIPIAQFHRGDEIKIQAYISGCLVNVSVKKQESAVFNPCRKGCAITS